VLAGAGVSFSTSADCTGLGSASTTGSVTWFDTERMWEVTAEGGVRCLFLITGDVVSIGWGPRGDRALINGTLVLGGEFEGAELPDNASWQFSYPTGKNLIGIDENGSVVKYLSESAAATVIDPITAHLAVAYHPSGLHIAISGDQVFDETLDPARGIFLANSDGTEPVNLAASFDADIIDVVFSNDAASIFFVADHGEDYHLHGNSVVPFELEDGTRQLGQGAEELAATLATAPKGAGLSYDTIVVHPADPSPIGWTSRRCGDGSPAFRVIDSSDLSEGAATNTPLVEGGGEALGFLGGDPLVITVAAFGGPCGGPGDLTLHTLDRASGTTEEAVIAGNVTAAAVRSEVAPHEWDLVDVAIAGFA